MSKLAVLAGLLAAVASPSFAQGLSGLLQLPNTYPNMTACLNQPSFFSCENTTAIENTCCSPTPGGLGEPRTSISIHLFLNVTRSSLDAVLGHLDWS